MNEIQIFVINQNLLMLALFVVPLLCVLTYAYFFFYLKPHKQMLQYKKICEKLGYRVQILPFSFLGSSKRLKHREDYKKFNDSYYSYKNSESVPDITIYNIFHKTAIDIGNVDLIKEFYQPNHIYLYEKYKPFINNLKRSLGDGILFSQEDDWKEKRRILNSVFNYQFIKDNVGKIREVCQSCLQQMEHKNLKSCPQNEKTLKVNFNQVFLQMLAKMIIQIFFGFQSSALEIAGEPAPLFLQKLNLDILKQSVTPRGLLFGSKTFELGLTSSDKNINERLKILKNLATQLIQKRITEIQKNGVKKGYGDVIEANYIKYQEKNKNFDKKFMSQIINQFCILYTAGVDTSSHFLEMILVYLCKNPKIQEKLRNQVAQVICQDSDINSQNLKKLKYIDWIQNQTTRMYGPATGIMVRNAKKDHYLGKIPIKKDTCISLMILGIHYSKQFYKNPLQFRPQRWESQCNQNPPFSLGGFGGGPRNCIGKHFALLETKIILIKILMRYKWLKLENNEIKMRISFMYEPENAKIVLEKKQS